MDAVTRAVERGRGMLGDEIALTLNSPITDEQFDAFTDVDMENTPRIVFHTKNGKEVEYLKVVRCEDCRYANECHKSVQYTRNEPNTVTIGYSPIKWCSRGEK